MRPALRFTAALIALGWACVAPAAYPSDTAAAAVTMGAAGNVAAGIPAAAAEPGVDNPLPPPCGPASNASEPAIADASNLDALLPCPPSLEPAVRFWIRVYTRITTDAGFIHDQQNLSIVYETLHFAANEPPRARRREVDAERKRFQDILRRLAGGAAPTDAEERHVLALWGPLATPARLRQAAEDVRFQLGQADRFRAGLVRSGEWQQDIAQVLARDGLPPELSVLPDVESSFNPMAYSKAGAAGLWQFLRSTGRRFMRINATIDERFDPFRETEAAAQLLAYNYQLLGSWPLAITAYNHGAAGMLKAREELGTDDIARVLRDYHSRTFGFASRNFYVSFLAALTVARDPQRYFGPLHEDAPIRFHTVRMPASASVATLEQALGVDRQTLRELNPALRPAVFRGRRSVPAGYSLRLPVTDGEWTEQLLARRLEASQAVLAAAQVSARKRGGTLPSTLGVTEVSATMAAVTPPAAAPLPGVDRAAIAAGIVTPLLAANALPGAAGANPIHPTGGLGPLVAESLRPSYYLVRPQDTIGSIAAREGVPLQQLLALNALPSADFLYTGERLRLVASAPAPDAQGAAATDVLAQQAEQESVQEQQAVALETSAAASAEPVSAQQAEAEGPPLLAGLTGPQSADPEDYSVGADGTIRVVAAETLGQYAEWLNVTASDLRRLNHLRSRTPVVIGRRLKLDLRRVPAAEFEQRRREYHQQLEAAYFASHHIVGTTAYLARRGDSLWNITRDHELPIWLLQQYNPTLDFSDLKPGTRVALPQIEQATGS